MAFMVSLLLVSLLFVININYVTLFVYYSSRQSVITASNIGDTNNRPIIGILSQEYYGKSPDGKNYSYIAASYVKYMEAGGARVIPIHLNKNESYYDDILKSINGILIPGGSASLTDSQYAEVGKKILAYGTHANDDGIYFPIWATCLGLEFLATQLVPGHDIITNCSATNLAMSLNLTEDYNNSRLMHDLPTDVYSYLTNLPVTSNFHHKCVTPQSVSSSGLDQYIHILSKNDDQNGIEFVSSFEVKNYPFYAVQWHPEKNPYEWTTKSSYNSIPHSKEAIRISQHFANFFVDEARKNNQKFENPNREIFELIYNIDPIYSGKTGSEFLQIYKFAVE